MSDRLFEVVHTARVAPGGPSHQSMRRAAAAHRHPEYEPRLDARRGELALLDDEVLEARARAHGFTRGEPLRSLLIEKLARHEVAVELGG